MKKSDDTIGNRTRDLPTSSAVPQPTALPRVPRIREVPGSNLSLETGRIDGDSSSYRYCQAVGLQIRPRPLPFTSLPIRYSLMTLRLIVSH